MSDPAPPARPPVELGRPRWGWVTRRTLGRGLVRLLSLVGVTLLMVGLTGWWLATRVMSDEGFADVVAKSVRQPAVSHYIAQRVSLQLAPTNKIFTAARPVATTVVEEVLKTDAVAESVHSVVAAAHHQVFQITDNDTLVNVSAASAVATIKAALQSIDPKVADRVPDQVLSVATSVTQNQTIALAASAAPWVAWGYIPVGLLGVLLLLLVFSKAREPVRAVRYTGLSLAVVGALAIGLGAATPLFARVAESSSDPGRGEAIAAFIDVLLGRLVGAGGALVVVGAILTFAPGRDGSSAPVRLRRLTARLHGVRVQRRGQLLLGVLGLIVGLCIITVPTQLGYFILWFAGLTVVWAGLVTLLRAGGVLETSAATVRLRKRQVSAVALTMVACIALTTAATATVLDASTHPRRADPQASGCNGYYELCFLPINQILWPASHNSMSSVAYNSITAEHISSIPEQLNQGARALLIDAYNGRKVGSLIRTNFTGEINRQTIVDELGGDALRELDRLGALTGATNTSGKGQDVYLCHLFCELGAVKASTVFDQVNDFLDQHLTDVVMLDVEDYVSPAQLEAALKRGGLWDRVYHLDLSKPMPTLLDIVTPPDGQDQAQRRVIITSENRSGQAPWLVGSYQLMQETPYTFTSTSQFNCQPNRGASTNPMLLVNHWLRSPGPPDPVGARSVNSEAELTKRLEQCIKTRNKLPNLVATDFFGIGATVQVCETFNAAVSRVTETGSSLDQLLALARRDPASTDEDIAELDDLDRLPDISLSKATALLGPVGAALRKQDNPGSGSQGAVPASDRVG